MITLSILFNPETYFIMSLIACIVISYVIVNYSITLLECPNCGKRFSFKKAFTAKQMVKKEKKAQSKADLIDSFLENNSVICSNCNYSRVI